MGHIKRWSYEKKNDRKSKIGNYIPCPICYKSDGLSTFEGEWYLKCQHCGAKYKKMQKYIRNRDGGKP